jgi:3-hydroxyisobutyrate dehydrogenase
MPDSHEFRKLGFIGLGAMGRPMLSHLARKLPSESRIWVYDVVEKMVDEACEEFPDRVLKAKSAKDVAEQVACFLPHRIEFRTDYNRIQS